MTKQCLAPLVVLVTVTAALVATPTAGIARQSAASAGSGLTCAEMEAFLKTAKVLSQRGTPVGITAPSRAVLEEGGRKHDASIQTVDIRKNSFEGSRGTEINFRDAWQFNVAGYELAKLLKLNMVPPYVERRVGGKDASVSWWVNDAMMEKDRYQKKLNPPNPLSWSHQLAVGRMFHELIGDTDFNLTNVLISKDWHIWMIDFSRAFRMTKTLLNPKQLTKIDRTVLANLRGLTQGVVEQALGRWLGKLELEGLMARRDQIVKFFDQEIAAKGEAVVLYDFPQLTEPCGTGLD